MDKAYKEAKRRVKAKKEFYKELTSFVGVSVLLVFINVFSSPYYLWCLWAIGPWGITLFIKGIKLAGNQKSDQWEQNELRKELISMGKNPDDYMDEHLELKELDVDNVERGSKNYNNSDLV